MTREADVPQALAAAHQRYGRLDLAHNAGIFLASEQAAYITGQTIVVDGGQLLPESPCALEACGYAAVRARSSTSSALLHSVARGR